MPVTGAGTENVLESSPKPSEQPSMVAAPTQGQEPISGTLSHYSRDLKMLPYIFSQNCPGCNNSDLSFSEPQRPVMDVTDVLREANRGCSSCQIIAWVLEPYVTQLIRDKYNEVRIGLSSDKSEYLRYGTPRSSKNVVAEIEVRGMPKCNDPAFLVELEDTCPWPRLLPANMISGDTGSWEAIARVKSWLAECSKHPKCLSTSASRLPTRILRIDSTSQVRLHAPENEYAQYACLSHCWGNNTMIKTTTSNLQKHMDGFAWSDLPKTFQEALDFTRRLGLQYLWVDSLCVLQDCGDDWRHEGSKMAEIYANAYITLAATKSADSSHGCFSRCPSHMSRTKTFMNSSNQPYKIHCRKPLEEGPTPLHQRAWAFQERILSKRVVQFMANELRWECNQTSTCECSSYRHMKSPAIVQQSHLEPDTQVYGVAIERVWITGVWTQLVQDYTKKSLTFPTDIFPALQGLAKLVPPIMGQYLAGHWENTLPASLDWRTLQKPSGEFGPRESRRERAPSWSWASSMCPVEFFYRARRKGYIPRAQVVRVYTVPVGDDPTGQISYGEIVLKGQCLAGRLVKTLPTGSLDLGSGQCYYDLQVHQTYFPFSLDHDVEPMEGTQILAIKIGDHEDTYTALVLRSRVTAGQLQRAVHERSDTYNALVQRIGVTEPQRAAYERIGRMVCSSGHMVRRFRQFNSGAEALFDQYAVEMEVTIT